MDERNTDWASDLPSLPFTMEAFDAGMAALQELPMQRQPTRLVSPALAKLIESDPERYWYQGYWTW